MTSEEVKKRFYEILFYNKDTYNNEMDKDNFVLPFIAMNDGHTPAQIRYENEGIYHDVQRSPFKRVSGVIGEDGKIPDIDVTSLVKFGTLEQAKIAPTLENIDIKLYFREPKLKKIKNPNPSVETAYADEYVWREAQPGFHVYNNDTLYGYEWIVLQDDYSTMDGVYNLSMNIEDGLGVCKLAGTQAPISLKGVQYKIIITAKNLWTREYSLMDDTFPIIGSMSGDTDEFAPSVNAVKNYYKEKVATKILDVENSATFADRTTIDKTGIDTNKVKTKDLEVEGKEVVYMDDLEAHTKETIKDPILDAEDKVVGVHGIVNDGVNGNINAKSLGGIGLGTGSKSVTTNMRFPAYVPFVDGDNFMGVGNSFGIFTKRASQEEVAKKLVSILYANEKANVAGDGQKDVFVESTAIHGQNLSAFVKSLTVSNKTYNTSYIPGTDPVVSLTSGTTFVNNVTFKVKKIETSRVVADEVQVGGFLLNDTSLQGIFDKSSISYKRMISELLPFDIKGASKTTRLTPNLELDSDGNYLVPVDTQNLEGRALLVSPDLKNHIPTDAETLSKDKSAFDKLGSALQALHELPLGTYVYKRGQEEYKQQLGIFVERVNQIRDLIQEARGTAEEEGNVTNYVVHKRNSWMKSSGVRIQGKDEGLGDSTDGRVTENLYSYSPEEIKSIIHYLDLTTSKKELQQEIRNTVGILLKAAQETQDRLLDIETSVYGWDSPTVPGNAEGRTAFVERRIAPELRDSITNSPLLLGLNRLMRAICLEVFDTTDLEKIEAETESRVTDSESGEGKVTVKTRMDQIDEIMSVLYNQSSAMVKYYMENVLNDEVGHAYTDMYTATHNQLITDQEGLTETPTENGKTVDLRDNVKVTHDTSKDTYDVGRKWKNLPAAGDLELTEKSKVGFAQVSDKAHKHSPLKEETGLVRVPSLVTNDSDDISEGSIEHEDYSKYLKGGKKARTWQLFKVDKYKESSADEYAALGTYEPLFKTKVVAWESAKVERMNNKLSELTKAVYGTDDVVAMFPNRTEVLRRNITNLVDDLYPNRSFDVEGKVNILSDPEAEIYKPFKKSNKTILGGTTPEGKVASANPNGDEGSISDHKSIIPYFDEEIFNFNIDNFFVGKRLRTGEFGFEYLNGKQINLQKDKIVFDTSKLVTDTNPFDSYYGTYANAYSRVDMLEDLLGVENCYLKSIFDDNILGTGNYEGFLSNVATGTNPVVADLTSQLNRTNNSISSKTTTLNNLKVVQADLEKTSGNLYSKVDELNNDIEKANENVSQEEANISKWSQDKLDKTGPNGDDDTTSLAYKSGELSNLEAQLTSYKDLISEKETELENIEKELKTLEGYGLTEKQIETLRKESVSAEDKLEILKSVGYPEELITYVKVKETVDGKEVEKSILTLDPETYMGTVPYNSECLTRELNDSSETLTWKSNYEGLKFINGQISRYSDLTAKISSGDNSEESARQARDAGFIIEGEVTTVESDQTQVEEDLSVYAPYDIDEQERITERSSGNVIGTFPVGANEYTISGHGKFLKIASDFTEYTRYTYTYVDPTTGEQKNLREIRTNASVDYYESVTKSGMIRFEFNLEKKKTTNEPKDRKYKGVGNEDGCPQLYIDPKGWTDPAYMDKYTNRDTTLQWVPAFEEYASVPTSKDNLNISGLGVISASATEAKAKDYEDKIIPNQKDYVENAQKAYDDSYENWNVANNAVIKNETMLAHLKTLKDTYTQQLSNVESGIASAEETYEDAEKEKIAQKANILNGRKEIAAKENVYDVALGTRNSFTNLLAQEEKDSATYNVYLSLIQTMEVQMASAVSEIETLCEKIGYVAPVKTENGLKVLVYVSGEGEELPEPINPDEPVGNTLRCKYALDANNKTSYEALYSQAVKTSADAKTREAELTADKQRISDLLNVSVSATISVAGLWNKETDTRDLTESYEQAFNGVLSGITSLETALPILRAERDGYDPDALKAELDRAKEVLRGYEGWLKNQTPVYVQYNGVPYWRDSNFTVYNFSYTYNKASVTGQGTEEKITEQRLVFQYDAEDGVTKASYVVDGKNKQDFEVTTVLSSWAAELNEEIRELKQNYLIEDRSQMIATRLKAYVRSLNTAGKRVIELKSGTYTDIDEETGQATTTVTIVDKEDCIQYKTTMEKVAAEDSKGKTETQISKVKEEIKTLENDLDKLTSNIKAAEERIVELGITISKLEAERDETLANIPGDYTLEIQNLTKEIEVLQALKKDLEDQLAEENLKNSGSPLTHYLDELSFLDFSVIKGDGNYTTGKLSGSITGYTNVSFVLSRKTKKIQERISTTESFLDSLSRGIHYGNHLWEDIEEQNRNKLNNGFENKRFEEVEAWETLKRICDSAEHKNESHVIFDLDLSESVTGCETHNKKVWQKVYYSRGISKTVFTPTSGTTIGSYQITGTMVSDRTLLPFQDANFLIEKGSDWTISVEYVTKKPDTLNNNTIYLKGKVSENKNLYDKFGPSGNIDSNITTVLKGSEGFQNQTEYNIYKTIKNIVTSMISGSPTDKQSLYYNLMTKAYPVGSVYMTTSATNPASIFGGTWKQIQDKFLLGVGSKSSNRSGQAGGKFSTMLKATDVPKHTHDKGSYNITGSFMSDSNRGTGLGGAFYYWYGSGQNDGWSGWVPQYVVGFDAARSWTGYSGYNYNGEQTELEFTPPYYSVYIWERTSL